MVLINKDYAAFASIMVTIGIFLTEFVRIRIPQMIPQLIMKRKRLGHFAESIGIILNYQKDDIFQRLSLEGPS